MRWDDFRQSGNVEDDRDSGGGFGGGFGGGMPGGGFGIPMGGGGLGIGTIIVLGIIGYALGIDPSVLIGGAETINRGGYTQPSQQQRPRTAPRNDQAFKFVSAILGNTEDVWSEVFKQNGRTYQPTKLVLFSQAIQGGCGFARAATGPFYCPQDKRIYLDTSFFREIETRFRGCTGKACEFAQAYVIAHEVGHHVQDLLGRLGQAQRAQQSAGDRAGANRIQVRVELQADCYAGVWAHNSDAKWKSIEPGDFEAALRTAAAIGDDRLQQQSQGRIVPDSFTHGTSAQRQRWFSAGLKDGKISDCDTFSAANL